MRLPSDIILVCIRWHVAYPLSYRRIGELMEERGALVDRSTINRWATRFLPRSRSYCANTSARSARVGEWMRGTSRVKGACKNLFRAVDKEGKAVDFLLPARRDVHRALEVEHARMEFEDV
jgi:putative transposase